MVYSIHFFRGGMELGSTPWDKGLEAGKKHAETHMNIKGADRVEVRNDAGAIVFHFPRVLRAG